MDLIARVRSFIRQHDLIRSDTRVAAAVSGGSDSVALALVLDELDRAHELRFAGLVHFNHQLRASADRDERFVAELAGTLGRPFIADRDDVASRARRERRSIEDAGRVARYAAFERAREQLGAGVIATGHTRDDQAETFLLRLVRGAGPRGLAAMHPRNGSIVRPLLECRREELCAELTARGASYVEDETNADVSVPRNRVRAELLPLLASRFNPHIVDTLANEAELLQELWSWLEAERERFGRDLDVSKLDAAPPALRRLVVWRAMTDAAGGGHISFDHVAAVLRLIERRQPGEIHAPGQRVQLVGERLVLHSRPAGASRADPANLFWYPLSIPGEVTIPATGDVVTAETQMQADPAGPLAPGAMASNGATAVVRADLAGESLAVRNRRPGDRFRPVGLNGWKKLQDLFVDRKVARHERDAVPLVVDAHDRIVWVAGFGIDEVFRVTDPSQAVLVLRLMRPS